LPEGGPAGHAAHDAPTARGSVEGSMTTYREEQTVTRTDTVEPVEPVAQTRSTSVTYREKPTAMIERLIVFIFGIIQVLILLRILLLLVAAREGNAIVAFIYSISDLFVAPFRGILRMNEIASGQLELDVAAIVALVGWTILELILIWLLRVFRPSTTA
jgi:uncharacterized protein YggT (Ycf19 family)